jgi:hypothetical protein
MYQKNKKDWICCRCGISFDDRENHIGCNTGYDHFKKHLWVYEQTIRKEITPMKPQESLRIRRKNDRIIRKFHSRSRLWLLFHPGEFERVRQIIINNWNI